MREIEPCRRRSFVEDIGEDLELGQSVSPGRFCNGDVPRAGSLCDGDGRLTFFAVGVVRVAFERRPKMTTK